jgi:1-aminocyclopropane-1-carboxylate deaminase
MALLSHSSPLERISSALFPDIQLWIKRDDLLHPTVSGNKMRKLKYNLLQIGDARPTLVSMGGAWSNHLHALAHAAKLLDFKSIGLVRGLHAAQHALNPTLSDCAAQGMQLRFVSRDDYRDLRDLAAAWRQWVSPNTEDYVWLPEGGSNSAALAGVAELVAELADDLGEELKAYPSCIHSATEVPDTIIVACGTGATLAGILAGLGGKGRVIGIAAVSNAGYLRQQVLQLLRDAGYPAYQNFEILLDYTHGGFAKTTPELMQFCALFSQTTHIQLEPVYTGKMLHALSELCRRGKFRQGERVVAIHTGGLQGLRGYSL